MKVKYDLYTISVAAVDAAHEMGIVHGIRLNHTSDYDLLAIMFLRPVFYEEEAQNNINSMVPAGPSMSTFYENLGRVVRGEWWLYANPDSGHDFCSKCRADKLLSYFQALATVLCYDFFGYTAAKFGRNDPTFVTSHFEESSFLTNLQESFCATMSGEFFLEMYQLFLRPTGITDRKRWRRQRKADCLVAFRNRFHK
jgi:hypothetical protein